LDDESDLGAPYRNPAVSIKVDGMEPIHVSRIDHVAIDITDLERSKSFYAGVLGLSEVPRPASFDFGGAWYQIGPEVLHLVCRDAPFPPAPHHFCLWVEDIQTAANQVATAGYQVTWDTRYKIPGIDRFFVRDPDGNRVEFQGAECRG
jgi:catechol 2,3-dioxygenase-like lactoylglutathione lyase family enzyme